MVSVRAMCAFRRGACSFFKYEWEVMVITFNRGYNKKSIKANKTSIVGCKEKEMYQSQKVFFFIYFSCKYNEFQPRAERTHIVCQTFPIKSAIEKLVINLNIHRLSIGKPDHVKKFYS